jgi:presequence protease
MAFLLRRRKRFDAQKIEFMEFEDERTGAWHIHLASESPELAFAISLPTASHENDGRAHVLEHLALCGSERYPVKDPFFAMSRRTLAAFMNAMTFSDHTVYPIASQEKADYLNLMDVYLDAVFFPKLDRLDFLQEGWRHEIGESGRLELHGVVLNEMRGEFADPLLAVELAVNRALFPGSAQAADSGGDPLEIPSLTHEALVAFHRERYHPSQATFWTFGAIDPSELHARWEERALARFAGKRPRAAHLVSKQPAAPLRQEIGRPVADGEDADHSHGFLACWMLGETGKDDEELRDWELFHAAVYEDSASPLAAALEAAGFGRPSEARSLDIDRKQGLLCVGMDSLSKAEVPRAREAVFAELRRLAEDGVGVERMEALERAMEIDEREGGGHNITPGLKKIFDMIAAESRGGDALRAIDSEARLAHARQSARDPEFAKRMAKKLLDSPARAEFVVKPDAKWHERRERAEKKALERAQAALTPEKRAKIEADAAALRERQRAPSDSATLPKILPSQVGRKPRPLAPIEFRKNERGASTAWAQADSDGMGVVALDIDASVLPEELWPWADALAELSLSLGCGERSSREAQAWRQAVCVDAEAELGADAGSAASGSRLALRLSVSCRALAASAGEAARAIAESWESLRLDEHKKLRQLIRQRKDEMQQAVAEMGGTAAEQAATSSFGPRERFCAAVDGAAGLRFWVRLAELSKTPEGMEAIEAQLRRTREALSEAPALLIWIGEEAPARAAFEAAAPLLARHAGYASLDAVAVPAAEANLLRADTAIEGSAPVNECFAVWEGPRRGDADAPVARALAAWLTNAFLHRAVREEGGAYGADVRWDGDAGAFVMSSFRDPRLAGTFKDFEACARFAQEAEIDEETLHEAILSVAQTLDEPMTPTAWASWSLKLAQLGISEADRERMRAGLLDCDAGQLKAAARRWLSGPPAVRCAFARTQQAKEARAIGLAVEPLVDKAKKAKAGPRP